MLSKKPEKPEPIKDLWIIVGDDSLDPQFEQKIETKCAEKGWSYFPLSLATRNRAVHSGCAVNRALALADTGELMAAIYDKQGYPDVLDTDLFKEPRHHCFVSENRFYDLPKYEKEPAHVKRVDNGNQCLRAYGVDGGNSDTNEKLLRSTLETFILSGVPGDRGQVATCRIHPPTYTP
jgi:hypothetical protein